MAPCLFAMAMIVSAYTEGDAMTLHARLLENNNIVTVEYAVAKGYEPFLPTIAQCKAMMHNASSTDGNIRYLVVLTKPDHRHFMVLTSHQTRREARREVANIVSQLHDNYAAAEVIEATAKIDVIVSLINTGYGKYQQQHKSQRTRGDAETEAKITFKHIVEKAVAKGASDFSIVIAGDHAFYSFSIDGRWTAPFPMVPSEARRAVASELQTEADHMTSSLHDSAILERNIPIDIAPEIDAKRQPQHVRLRAAKVPKTGGYSFTARIIKTAQAETRNIANLGYDPTQTKILKTLPQKANGIVCITGPTNHGKTMTLKALYEQVPSYRRLVVCEDPVEYLITHPHAIQQEIVDEEGLTASSYGKASLRQAAAVIGISELRDPTIADMAVNLALTGHLMVSTLHTHDTLTSLARLAKLGVDYKTQALKGLFRAIISQRLIPKLCNHCKVKGDQPAAAGGREYYVVGDGCQHCGQTGVNGRQLVGEILVFDNEIRQHLANGDLYLIEQALRRRGWKSMLDIAMGYVAAGIFDPTIVNEYLGEEAESGNAYFNYQTGDFHAVDSIDAVDTIEAVG